MKKIGMGLIAMVLLAPPVWASTMSIQEAAQSPEYGKKFGGMIGRGVVNVATCFMDLLVDTVNETKQGPPLVGTLVGLGKGAGCTTLRALSGGVDLVTFWVPGFNGFPVSASYENCLATSAAEGVGTESHPAMPAGYPSEESSWSAPSSSTPSTPAPKHEKPRYTK